MGQPGKAEYRAKLFRALHAEGLKRGLDHEALHEECRGRFGAQSMAALNLGQLKTLFRDLAGKNFSGKHGLPRAGYPPRRAMEERITPEEMELLAKAFALRGWSEEMQRVFVRRQTGRNRMRTRSDFWRVFSGVRAMNRRDGLAP